MVATSTGSLRASNPIVGIIISVAQGFGLDPRIAVADAIAESGLDPKAVGDSGTSFGLYQLHRGGELGNLTPTQAFDPTTNAMVALAVMANVAHQHPGWSPGQIAAAAERPANQTAYAARVDQIYQTLPADLSTLGPGAGSAITASSQQATLTSAKSSGSSLFAGSLLKVNMGSVGNLAQMAGGVFLVLLGFNMLVKDLTGASPIGSVVGKATEVAAGASVAGPAGAAAAAVPRRASRRVSRGRAAARPAARQKAAARKKTPPSRRIDAAASTTRRPPKAGQRRQPAKVAGTSKHPPAASARRSNEPAESARVITDDEVAAAKESGRSNRRYYNEQMGRPAAKKKAAAKKPAARKKTAPRRTAVKRSAGVG